MLRPEIGGGGGGLIPRRFGDHFKAYQETEAIGSCFMNAKETRVSKVEIVHEHAQVEVKN